MKKIFTLVFATLMAGNMMAQMHGALKFAGASTANVLTQNVENASDTVRFEMVNAAAGNITLPKIVNDNFVIPSFTIENVAFAMGANHVITMADQTFATKVTVGGEEKGGFFRDYKDDGLTFHFSAETGGKKTMDGDYSFNPEKDNNILVKYNGNKVEDIVNTFQMGSMPFAIVSKFTSAPTAITSVKSNGMGDGKIYNLNGQMVDKYYKGVVIVNGKKYLKK